MNYIQYATVASVYVSIISIIWLALSLRWSIFGLVGRLYRAKGYGLLLLKSNTDNIGFPKFVDLNSESIKVKKSQGLFKPAKVSIYAVNRDDFMGMRLFGFPFCIKDFDDATKSYGLYSPVKDLSNNQIFETITLTNEKGETVEAPTDIPKLTRHKSGSVVDPEMVHAIISKNTVLSSINQFMKNNKMVLTVAALALLASIAAAYFGYNIYNQITLNVIPKIGQCAATQASGTTVIPV